MKLCMAAIMAGVALLVPPAASANHFALSAGMSQFYRTGGENTTYDASLPDAGLTYAYGNWIAEMSVSSSREDVEGNQLYMLGLSFAPKLAESKFRPWVGAGISTYVGGPEDVERDPAVSLGGGFLYPLPGEENVALKTGIEWFHRDGEGELWRVVQAIVVPLSGD